MRPFNNAKGCIGKLVLKDIITYWFKQKLQVQFVLSILHNFLQWLAILRCTFELAFGERKH